MCHVITNIWWDILNPFMARGWSAFLWIFQKKYRLGEAETHWLYFFYCDTTSMHFEEQHPTSKHVTLKQTRITTIFWFRYQSCTWKCSGPSFQKKPCSGCISGINLDVMLSFNFLQTPNKSLRFTKFRRSNIHHSVIVQVNQCQIALLCFPWCALSKVSTLFFCGCLPPRIVHLRNLFLLSTPVVQMLLTPRWLSRRKHVT